LSDCSGGGASHFADAYRVAYPAATQKPPELSRSHVPVFRTVPSARTLVRRVDGNAFASIVQARPCPVFGRPVRLRGSPRWLRPGASPQTLRIPPHGGHPVFPDLCRGRRGITPAFGYSSLHPRARGTL